MAEFIQMGPEGRKPSGPEEVSLKPEGKAGVYFGNRLCPFAHRAWLAMHEKGLADKFDYIHIELGPEKPQWYQANFNPFGTVPAMYVDGKPVFESLPVAEFLEDKFPGSGNRIMPSDPHERAAVRVAVAALDVSPIYKLLMNQDSSKTAELEEAVAKALGKLDDLYAKQSPAGPYFLGDALSLADIAVLPFLDRFVPALRHYRGVHLFGADGARLPRLRRMLEAAQGRPAFRATAQSAEFYVTSYSQYASGRLSSARPTAPSGDQPPRTPAKQHS